MALLLGIPQAVDMDAETAQQSGQAAEEEPEGNANRNSGDTTNVFDPASSTIANILPEPRLPPYDNLFDGIEAPNSLQEQAVLVARFREEIWGDLIADTLQELGITGVADGDIHSMDTYRLCEWLRLQHRWDGVSWIERTHIRRSDWARNFDYIYGVSSGHSKCAAPVKNLTRLISELSAPYGSIGRTARTLSRDTSATASSLHTTTLDWQAVTGRPERFHPEVARHLDLSLGANFFPVSVSSF